ncbi:uncharacterized protein SCHCODRAFT_02663822 [Schizophyllum commune H4-8]|uniref:Uncharacterized protein n=1 Tax=Schizophyllum commune (strain H4-8 / FGSC 9210) TaxID=578458 RepID=D8PYF8_SCHCM|nr:uncharacterized protein SCHCODRAFT_02663822 [Schizophyllum commune H4-8]KAI5895938.1 hypothetical protein SCHCODRAFT_02663822 [Schizophyllum commune H4-8]
MFNPFPPSTGQAFLRARTGPHNWWLGRVVAADVWSIISDMHDHWRRTLASSKEREDLNVLEGQAINGVVVALGSVYAQHRILWMNRATQAYPELAAVIHVDPAWYNTRRTIVDHSSIRFTLEEELMPGTHVFVIVYGSFKDGILTIKDLKYSTKVCNGDAIMLYGRRGAVEIAVKGRTNGPPWVAVDIVYTEKDALPN